MISTLSRQGGRRYPQFGTTGLPWAGLLASVGGLATPLPAAEEDVWHGRRRKEPQRRKAWPLPPPQFHVEQDALAFQVLHDAPAQSPIPTWMVPRPRKPKGVYRGFVYRPPGIEPAQEVSVPISVAAPVYQEGQENRLLRQAAQALKLARRQREERLVFALIAQGKL